MFYYERKLQEKGCNLIIGIDEAGRGPLAGPVVAAAVALTDMHFKNRIDDSKKLTPLGREKAYLEIIKKSIFGIGIVNEKIIDRLNILVATRKAMELAIEILIKKVNPAEKSYNHFHILIDGNTGVETNYPFSCIAGGDAKSISIAAASILAKVTRDRIMCLYDKVYPEYGFLRHKGYPTQMHRTVIKNIGFSPIHRRTFWVK